MGSNSKKENMAGLDGGFTLGFMSGCDGEQILQEVQRFPDNFMFVYQQEKFNGSSTDSHTTIIPAL